MTKKAEIYYFTLTDELPREDKLAWFKNTRFTNIAFDEINPDDKGNWLNLTDNDFDNLMPVCDKEVKSGSNQRAIFQLFTNGVVTARDEWVYDFSKKNLSLKIQFFIKTYNIFIDNNNNDFSKEIKWSEHLKNIFKRNKNIYFNENLLIKSSYRPFINQYYYSEKILSDRLTQNHYDIFGENLDKENICIAFSFNSTDFAILATSLFFDFALLKFANGNTQCLPLYVYDKEGNPHENITDWALTQFQNHYQQSEFKPRFELQHANLRGFKNLAGLTKADIFHYVYAVLHNPAYREKYEQNLKREFPRIPFYDDFEQWAVWGKQLMALHINYETVEKYPLKRLDTPPVTKPKAKLKADKINSVIQLDDNTCLSGISLQAWEYKLGNRSALEWVLDQYKEKKPKDPTIAEKFNTYRFADYKEQVIELLMRVCTVSVETMKIVEAMKET